MESIIEILKAIFGFFLLLFIPGFAASYAFFERKIDVIERIVLSVGLSIVFVTLTIFALNFLFGISINLINSFLVAFSLTLIFVLIALLLFKKNSLSGKDISQKKK